MVGVKKPHGRPAQAHSIGVADARASLSRLLQAVKRGGEWIVTKRGRPIARLVPTAREPKSLAERIRRLEKRGILEPISERTVRLFEPLTLKTGLAQDALSEDRDRGA
jgi:prevent-host-death family protein